EAERELGPRSVARPLVAVDAGVGERRPEDRQPLAELEHPGVVEVELLAPGEGVPRLRPLDVDRERRVAAAVRLDPGPLRRGDDGARLHLGVVERDPLARAGPREVGERDAGAALERAEALDREAAVRGPREGEDRLAGVLDPLERGPPVRGPPRTTPFAAASSRSSSSGIQDAPFVTIPSSSTSGP